MLNIDVTFDLICPWCLIGKRNLDSALKSLAASHPDVKTRINWHSVQLIPDVPPQGLAFAAFYEKRLGSQEKVRQRQAQVTEAAALSGLDIRLDRIAVLPNTGKAHRLLAFAASNGDATRYDALLERLFTAYFVLGENIGDDGTLMKIARDFGLNPAISDFWPVAPAERDVCPAMHSGVPFFGFNGLYNVAGAQSPEILYSAMLAVVNEGSNDDTPIPAAA